MICVCSFVRRAYQMPFAAWIVLGAGVGALVTAFLAQFLFHLDPCILCLWERVPYGAAAVFAAGALVFRQREGLVRAFLLLACLAFVANVGLSAFHTGVERHWWKGTDDCVADIKLDGLSADAMREALLAKPPARCDQIDWSLFGLSLTNYNVLACLALALFTALSLTVTQKKEDEPKPCCCCRDHVSNSESQ